MERQRRQQAEAAVVLHAALVCLNRGGTCREPLTPGMFSRPNLKGLQAVMHLLHLRIRGAARTKKELQHIYPVLEPAQAREFKAAMQAWVRELGAAGMVSPDTIKYFVSAYQGSSSHRTVLMLLDLCATALAKELGTEGPQATLLGAEAGTPGTADAVATGPSQGRSDTQAAAAALRQGQARLDAVVAAMQRVRQLHGQAVGQLASGQAASGGAAQQLAPRVPPLFAGSQVNARRGELVLELLAQGPQITRKPEAVGPESWADLLAAGRGGAAPTAGAGPSAAAVSARRLSNPAQEASSFAAEGLAADADVLTVHQVLVKRLAATGAALQAAAAGGATPGSSEVHAALAEAGACREALVLSVRQELASAKVRSELQAPSSSGSSTPTSVLQLLPPAVLACNPVQEGMQAAQEAAAAAGAAVAAASGSCGWGPPDDAAVQALRRSMWQQAQTSRAGCSMLDNSQPPSPAAAEAEAAAAAAAAAGAAGDALACTAPVQASAAEVPAAPPEQHTTPMAAHGSSSSKAPGPMGRAAAAALDSPSLADVVNNGIRGLAMEGLLSEEEAHASSAMEQHMSAEQQQQQPAWPPTRQKLWGQHQLPPGSPCMAESCASASVVAENHSSGGGSSVAAFAAVAAARRQHRASSRALQQAASPMMSAAGSVMAMRPQRHEQQQQQSKQWSDSSQTLQPHSSSDLPPESAAAAVAGHLPAAARSPAVHGFGPGAGASPLAMQLQHLGSGSAFAGGSDRPFAQAAAAGSSRRQATSVAFTLTPPRRLEDSPAPQAAVPRGSSSSFLDSDGVTTPISHLHQGGSRGSMLQQTPAPSPLHPMQLQQRGSPALQLGSPALLASCFKSQPGALAPSPFASPLPATPLSGLSPGGTNRPQPGAAQSARWALAAGRSASPAGMLDSPRGSSGDGGGAGMGRRRSAMHTTSSPAGRAEHRHQQGRSSPASASPLFTPPRSLVATPGGPSDACADSGGSVSHLGATSKTVGAGVAVVEGSSIKLSLGVGGDLQAMRQRMARLMHGPPA